MCAVPEGRVPQRREALFIIREGATWIQREDIADPPLQHLKPALAVWMVSLLLHVMDVYLSPPFGGHLHNCMLYVLALDVCTY